MLQLEVSDLYKLMETLQKDIDGYASFTLLLKEASAFYGCNQLTVRNFILKRPQFFELKRGQVRVKLVATLEEQEEDLSEFYNWQSNRTEVLEECLQFLQVQNLTPFVQNLLVLAANARNEFNSYSDRNLVELMDELRREFDFTPQKSLNVTLGA
jgi:hypothetical protein